MFLVINDMINTLEHYVIYQKTRDNANINKIIA
jgi:hypothetical protein